MLHYMASSPISEGQDCKPCAVGAVPTLASWVLVPAGNGWHAHNVFAVGSIPTAPTITAYGVIVAQHADNVLDTVQIRVGLLCAYRILSVYARLKPVRYWCNSN